MVFYYLSLKRTLSFIFFRVDESLIYQTSWREIWEVLFTFLFHMKLLPPLEVAGKLERYRGLLLKIVGVVVVKEFVGYFEQFDHY